MAWNGTEWVQCVFFHQATPGTDRVSIFVKE
jgi:hypothetical protein